jgi:hypothetical protein
VASTLLWILGGLNPCIAPMRADPQPAQWGYRSMKPSSSIRTQHRRNIVWLVAALGAAPACAPVVASSGPHSVRTVDPNLVRGPYAPAGQRFSVRLDQAIDTQESLRRGTFTARLQTPLVGADGRVFAAAGTTVSGHIRSLGSMESPRVLLRFDSIDTVFGPAPLQASLRGAQYRRYPGPVLYSVWPGYPVYDGYWGAYGWGPIGGGPGYAYYGGYWDYFPYRPPEVHLPAGARMDLLLTRPLFAPGTTVERR